MTATNEHKYLQNLNHVFITGEISDDRTGVGTLSTFGGYTEYEIPSFIASDGELYFTPIFLTTKKMFPKIPIHEIRWMLMGCTNTSYLRANGITIWDEWADENGELGPIYGAQWRNWGNQGIDQIKQLESDIKTNPKSRRLIVEGWNVSDIHKMKLPPCHKTWQIYISKDGYMDLFLYQRSADMFLGVPYNLAFYSILLCMLAYTHGYKPRKLIHATGDAHIYKNHYEQVREQLNRPIWQTHPYMRILTKRDSIVDYVPEDFEFTGYQAQPAIQAPVAI